MEKKWRPEGKPSATMSMESSVTSPDCKIRPPLLAIVYFSQLAGVFKPEISRWRFPSAGLGLIFMVEVAPPYYFFVGDRAH
ncbi:MAG: hypothetical protein ACJAX1_000464 [Neolewinella sp.]|jgi:hypothetical protein